MGMIYEILLKVTRGGKGWLWMRGGECQGKKKVAQWQDEYEKVRNADERTGNERILRRG